MREAEETIAQGLVASWGMHEGKEVSLIRVESRSGSYVELTNLGASVVSVVVPDSEGELSNIVLGFPTLSGYLEDRCYIGRTIGRVANRITRGQFELNGTTHSLDKNDGTNTNHGGTNGFHNKVFDFEIRGDSVLFYSSSPDGENGFPGNMDLRVEYTWVDDELKIHFSAQSDQDTIANFTNHAYFNMSGCMRDGLHQNLTISADRVLESTQEYLPTGRILPAGGLAMTGQKLCEVTSVVGGINTYYVRPDGDDGRPLAKLEDRVSGRSMVVYTSYPGLMLYTADFLESETAGNHENRYKPFDGVCLECQHYPDSPNHPDFPPITLKKGEKYSAFIKFKFKNNRS